MDVISELFVGATRTSIEASDAHGTTWTADAYQTTLWPSDDKWVFLHSRYPDAWRRDWEDIGYPAGPMQRLWLFDDALTIVTWGSGELAAIVYEDPEVYHHARAHRLEQCRLTTERDRATLRERMEKRHGDQ